MLHIYGVDEMINAWEGTLKTVLMEYWNKGILAVSFFPFFIVGNLLGAQLEMAEQLL